MQADLTRLFNDCGFSWTDERQFEGALELGELARERNAIERRNASLVDITAVVLKRYLPKDPAIRTSMRWDDPTLSAEYEAYAALDAYAAWAIFQSLSIIPTSGSTTLASITTPGTRVRLVTRNGTLSVAYGYISQHQPKHFNGVKVTSGRIVVTLESIIIPAYRVRAELLSTHQDMPLSAFGSQLPFSLLCCIRDLRASPIDPGPSQSHTNIPLMAPSSLQPTKPKSLGDGGNSAESESHEQECDKCDVVCNCEILSSESCRYDPNLEQSIASAEKDSGSLQKAQALDEMMTGMQGVEEGVIRSRVLGDIWHLMNQFKISVHHGLRRPFSRALRDALFILDPEDVANVEKVLKVKDLTFKNAVLYFSDWVWQRVKRCVPPAEILASRVVEVFRMYSPLKDAKTSQPLFNDDSWETARTIMENIKMGYYSDPPGMKFYTFVRKDKNGLSIYRCSRGTNNVEGEIHQNIIRRFGSFNASPCLAVNLLRDYCLSHNLKVRKRIA